MTVPPRRNGCPSTRSKVLSRTWSSWAVRKDRLIAAPTKVEDQDSGNLTLNYPTVEDRSTNHRFGQNLDHDSYMRTSRLHGMRVPNQPCGSPRNFCRVGTMLPIPWLFNPSGRHPTYGAHKLQFITCSCYRRLPSLSSAHSTPKLSNVLGPNIKNRRPGPPI